MGIGMGLGIGNTVESCACRVQGINDVWAKIPCVKLPAVPAPVIETSRCNEKNPGRNNCEKDDVEGPA